MKKSSSNKAVSVLLSVAMCPMLVPTAAFAAEEGAASDQAAVQAEAQAEDTQAAAEGATASVQTADQQAEVATQADGAASSLVVVNGSAGYDTLEAAFAAAEPDADGVITYTISGKVMLNDTGWVQILRAGSTANAVKFVGNGSDAEICIANKEAILADQSNDVDVSFIDLKLSKLNPGTLQDYGQSTNYFTTWLRDNGASENTVTYTNCEFPNGVCNNQYGKTVFESCTFDNETTGLYNLWVYGGDVAVNGGSFTGTRGVKIYTEGFPTETPKTTISGASFKDITEKAAIVVSKPGSVVLDKVSASGCTNGLLQKKIDDIGSSASYVVEANGSGISGDFNITKNVTSEDAKNEFNITGGTFTSEVPDDFLAEGVSIKDNGDGTYGVQETPTTTMVAECNGNQYESLQAAIDDAKAGKTVKLLSDTRENVTIAKTLTLDLAGFTLNGGSEYKKAALTIDNAKVTINDSSEGKTGTIKREDTAESSANGQYYYVIDIQGDKVTTFNGGQVLNNSGTTDGSRKGSSLVRIGDDTKSAYPQLTIKGGTFKQDNFVALKVDRGTLWINGEDVVVSSNDEAVKNWGAANIQAGTINGSFNTWGYEPQPGVSMASQTSIYGGTINGDVNAISYDGGISTATVKFLDRNGTPCSAVVNGKLGTKQGKTPQSLVDLNDASKATIQVQGGKFKESVASEFCASGYQPKQNEDGSYGVEKAVTAKVGEIEYDTLESAFNAACETGGTVVLQRDIELQKYPLNLTSGKEVTLDLNDHSFEFDVNQGINIKHGTLNIVGKGVISTPAGVNCGPVNMYGSADDLASYSIINVGNDVTLRGVEGIWLYSDTKDTPYGIVVNVNGKIEVLTDKTGGPGEGITVNGEIKPNTSSSNVPQINVGSTASIAPAEGNAGIGIFQAGYANTTIAAGASITGLVGIQVCAGNLTVNGGTIKSTGAPQEPSSASGAIQDGAAISIVDRSGYAGLGSININGGIITAESEQASAVKATSVTGTTVSSFTKTDSVEVSGGAFSSEVPSDLCAEGFAPAKSTDSEGNTVYGVAAGLVNFWGGSLRMDKYEKDDGSFETDKADLRFGFNFDLPEGAVREAFGFNWGFSADDLTYHLDGQNTRDAATERLDSDPEGVTGTISNLVITKIPNRHFGTELYAQMWVKYELNGSEYTIQTDVQNRSVDGIAQKILDAGNAGYVAKDSKQYRYAQAILPNS